MSFPGSTWAATAIWLVSLQDADLNAEMASHISKENNILYQIALQVLTPEQWDAVNAECDKRRRRRLAAIRCHAPVSAGRASSEAC